MAWRKGWRRNEAAYRQWKIMQLLMRGWHRPMELQQLLAQESDIRVTTKTIHRYLLVLSLVWPVQQEGYFYRLDRKDVFSGM